VVSYNVFCGAPQKDRVPPILLETQADLICLQEFEKTWMDAVYTPELRRLYPHVATNHNSGDRWTDGLAVFSRYPLEDVVELPPAGRGWFPAMVFKVRTPLGRVQVLHIHLRATADLDGLLKAPAVRLEEMKLHLAAAKLDRAEPVILVGDFNEGEAGPTMTWLKQRGFNDALNLVDPHTPTWRQTIRGVPLTGRPDHILGSSRLRCTQAQVIADGPSDHYPVVAVFERAPTPAPRAYLQGQEEAESRATP
jgi:endonuclease/exonuclease/phosphatase family metal-dependent hydrolase